jgi:hypothetical protein
MRPNSVGALSDRGQGSGSEIGSALKRWRRGGISSLPVLSVALAAVEDDRNRGGLG